MAIAKNTAPGKMDPNPQATVLKDRTPAPRKGGLNPARTASDQPNMRPVSAKERTIAVLESTPEEPITISPELRQRMIRDAAYFRAEQRGFVGGDPTQDWIEAEAEIAHMLGETKTSARKKSQASH